MNVCAAVPIKLCWFDQFLFIVVINHRSGFATLFPLRGGIPASGLARGYQCVSWDPARSSLRLKKETGTKLVVREASWQALFFWSVSAIHD